jgi:plastocyanin
MTDRRFTMLVALLVLLVVPMGCATNSVSPGATADETPATTATVEPTTSATPSASAAPTESEDAARDEERVTIATSDFEPATLTVAAGTEVVFENEATFDHTVTEGIVGEAVDDPLVDEQVAPGDEVRVVFDEPGTYDITCTLHPTMQMTITVED